MRDHIRNIAHRVAGAVRFAVSRFVTAVDLDGLIPAGMLAYGVAHDLFWAVLGACLFGSYLLGELRRKVT